jgi:hypothetical protein
MVSANAVELTVPVAVTSDSVTVAPVVLVGEPVTTRLIVVGVKYPTVPVRPVPPPVTVPVVVLVNPVPVNVIEVPNAAPWTRLGACDVTIGPATVIAGVNVTTPVVVPVFVTVTGTAPSTTPDVAAALNVADVPAAPLKAVYATSVAGAAVTVEYELKPDPVRVTVVAGAPTVSEVPLEAVITAATPLAPPRPRALTSGNPNWLLPAPVLVTVNEQSRGDPVAAVSTIVAVPEVGLVIAAPLMASATPLIVECVMSAKQFAESAVYAPPAAPGVLYVLSDNVAPYSKPEPSKTIG